MKMFFVCAIIALISFWSGFLTAALVSAGKEESDENENDDKEHS